MPMIKPNSEKLILVRSKKATIHTGCNRLISTNKVDVPRMIRAIRIDRLAAAPTYPKTISIKVSGADKCS